MTLNVKWVSVTIIPHLLDYASFYNEIISPVSFYEYGAYINNS